tara:strand:+ start:757 stop:2301 length:1545 start_codon:yes stop_codon:yes gene_type:complete
MLDAPTREQVAEALSRLDGPITLAVQPCEHPKQPELIALLAAVSDTSKHVHCVELGDPSPIPRVHIHTDQGATGVSFTGIPGGHEFSSLILAILNANGKGKLPDAIFLDRIQALRHPRALRTFVSLSCATCPDVVQALNMIAIQNPNIQHDTIDGGFTPELIDRLAVQGVPAVFDGNTLLLSGKTTLSDILDRLTESDPDAQSPPTLSPQSHTTDVCIVGGGPAGLSSAIYLARKGIKCTIVTDHVGGQLKDTLGIENFIGTSYTTGPELIQNLIKHVHDYPTIVILDNRTATRVTSDHCVVLNTQETIQAKAVIIATGAQWKTLNIPGEDDYIGNGVAFCPHCDGPFYANKPIAVIGGGNSGVEAAIDLANTVSHVTVLEFGEGLNADAVLVNRLHHCTNVTCITQAKTVAIIGNGTTVTGIQYINRNDNRLHTLDLAGVFVQIGLKPNSDLVHSLVTSTDYGEIEITDHCHTNIPGIFSAGDVTTTPYKQIVVASGEGAKAGMACASFIQGI